MDFIIRQFKNSDKNEVISMMKTFYSSDAVQTNGSQEIFEKDFDICISDNQFLSGFVFEADNKVLGYSMIAKSFSTEYGKQCVWIEDLYVKPQYRGNGIIPKFIKYIEENFKNSILKLEVENTNSHAVHVYNKCGFKKLDYIEMIKNI